MLAGLAIWALLEPSAPAIGGDWASWSMKFVLSLGSATGLAIGGVNGWLQGSKAHLIRGLLLGMIFGAVGASLGAAIGDMLSAIVGGQSSVMGAHGIILQILARILGLTPIGLCLGAGIGASTLSRERTVHGAIGGAIGGFIGGAIFDFVGIAVGAAVLAAKGTKAGETGEVGSLSRAIYAIVLPCAIALVISLIENARRQAWVRQSVGRNEGKEWPCVYNPTIIGRSETDHIPLFGDPGIRPQHAAIQREQGGWVLIDGGQGNTYLNGQPVARAPLTNGAQIQIGSTVLQFFLRSGPALVPMPDAGRGMYAPYAPYAYPGTQPAPVPTPVSAMQPTAVMQTSASMPTQAYAPAVPTLTAMDGPIAGKQFPVAGAIEVGREAQGIAIPFDTAASRRHASIAPSQGGLAVTDLGSTNGTFLNGQRIQQALAPSGSVVKFGNTSFRVS